MTTIRRFHPTDLLRFNNVNLDPLTETYSIHCYLWYLLTYPEYYQVAEHPSGQLMGYIFGKVEGEQWHGHVSALSVSPLFRRLGIASRMMNTLEEVSEKHEAIFVDLYVRRSNEVAVEMYEGLGYIVIRRVLDYYSETDKFPEEHAFDMRRPLSRDKYGLADTPMPDIHVRDL